MKDVITIQDKAGGRSMNTKSANELIWATHRLKIRQLRQLFQVGTMREVVDYCLSQRGSMETKKSAGPPSKKEEPQKVQQGTLRKEPKCPPLDRPQDQNLDAAAMGGETRENSKKIPLAEGSEPRTIDKHM